MFNFKPLNEQELQAKLLSNVIAGPGTYEIIAGEYTISKSSGKPMLKILCYLWDINRTKSKDIVQDFILAEQEEKVKAFCDSIGHPEWYWEGKINTMWLPKIRGDCNFYLQKDKRGRERPSISEYLPAALAQYAATDEVGQSLNARVNANIEHARAMAQSPAPFSAGAPGSQTSAKMPWA